MLTQAVGVVVGVRAFGDKAQELEVRLSSGDGPLRRALSYRDLTGTVTLGDTVLLNTTAQELGLGTGGYDFVMAVAPFPHPYAANGPHPGFATPLPSERARGQSPYLAVLRTAGQNAGRLSYQPFPRSDGGEVPKAERGLSAGTEEVSPAPGHIIKGRYLPCQHAVLTLEEQDEYAAVWDKTLDGFPVIVGQLHSQIAPAAAALALRGKKTAYIMTDVAALPMAFSQLVRQLKDAGLLTATFTCGQAWGGDFETVTLHSALLAARYIAHCDAAIVCQGPGNAGTGTRTGFSGIEQAGNMDIAAALGGSPVAIVRMSDADGRERHQGVSHHTRTTLELVRSRVRVALPAGTDVPEAIAARHDVQFADGTGAALDLLTERGITVSSMGRTPAHDPLFFASAAAAGLVAFQEAPRPQ